MKADKFIFEMPVYDGRTKEWRILNLNSGTVYSGTDETEEAASNAIEDGSKRAECIVKRLSLSGLFSMLNSVYAFSAKQNTILDKWAEFLDRPKITQDGLRDGLARFYKEMIE